MNTQQNEKRYVRRFRPANVPGHKVTYYLSSNPEPVLKAKRLGIDIIDERHVCDPAPSAELGKMAVEMLNDIAMDVYLANASMN